ncbi:hypothetical protein [Actinomadura sp. 9N215]|uniref:hypothetical protein n=1 Tax=Actinomadura sp. 9N215 TaxID=3375150 RepID=UPI0037AC4146
MTTTHERLREIWDDFENDDDLWVAVLTGAGDRSSSVGRDLKEVAAGGVRAVGQGDQRSRAGFAHLSVEQAFRNRYVWEERRMHDRDALEGPRAFAEKRAPVSEGC